MQNVEITTERLLLRIPNASDLEAWYAFAQEPDTMLHLGGVKGKSEAWRGLCTMVGAWSISGFGMFSVIERATGNWIGRIGPWQPAEWPGQEVGWGVLSAYAGRGFALEAAAASMDFVVDKLGWVDVIHTIAPGNFRSIALAQRLGSSNKGPTQLPAPHHDILVDRWGQNASEWRSKRLEVMEKLS